MPAASLQRSRSAPKVCRWEQQSYLRRVRSKLVAPRGDPQRKRPPGLASRGFIGSPGAWYSQSTYGRDGSGASPFSRSAATGPHAKPRPASAAGRTERVPSLMGRPECWTCPRPRRKNASAIARQWSIRTWLILGGIYGILWPPCGVCRAPGAKSIFVQ